MMGEVEEGRLGVLGSMVRRMQVRPWRLKARVRDIEIESSDVDEQICVVSAN